MLGQYISKKLYPLLKSFLFLFSADRVHDWFTTLSRIFNCVPFGYMVCRFFYGFPFQGSEKYKKQKNPIWSVDGLNFSSPVLLAAGFDYNGYILPLLWNMGFGGSEVGSVTWHPTAGNYPPRLTRLINNRSIQVYKGLKNDGVKEVVSRIERYRKNHKLDTRFIRGLSIARSYRDDIKTLEEATQDYLQSFLYVETNAHDLFDFYTVNISCPNAPGGEDFLNPDHLKKLVSELKKLKIKKPIYFKMPIMLEDSLFLSCVEVIYQSSFQGVVIGNLNKNYSELSDPSELIIKDYRGGLSGQPCFERSLHFIKLAHQHYQSMTIIGVGGIMTSKDALQMIESGAKLVQLISGMIFTGPHLIQEINHELAKKMTET